MVGGRSILTKEKKERKGGLSLFLLKKSFTLSQGQEGNLPWPEKEKRGKKPAQLKKHVTGISIEGFLTKRNWFKRDHLFQRRHKERKKFSLGRDSTLSDRDGY